MSPKDFIYDAIYKGAMRQGATEKAARDNAVMGLDDFRKSKFKGRASALIENRIKQAKKAKA